ncbi:MAG: DUF1553 domain-containing protein [Gemmataceae bacterium]
MLANRVWLHLFGRGLVPTADDFGVAGRPPTHPELLDHLAHRFMDDGWRVKKLIKHVVLSRTYQLASASSPQAREVDPDNTLLWRMAPRRLDAEALRDALLAVSEQLTAQPPVGSVVARSGEGPVSRPRLWRHRHRRGDQRRRGTRTVRSTCRSSATTCPKRRFDAADPSLITADRPTTTVPAQGLFLLNSPFVLRAPPTPPPSRLLVTASTDPLRVHAAYGASAVHPPPARWPPPRRS